MSGKHMMGFVWLDEYIFRDIVIILLLVGGSLSLLGKSGDMDGWIQ
jgi:hypothetical protein